MLNIRSFARIRSSVKCGVFHPTWFGGASLLIGFGWDSYYLQSCRPCESESWVIFAPQALSPSCEPLLGRDDSTSGMSAQVIPLLSDLSATIGRSYP